jgi:hypothetical protein
MIILVRRRVFKFALPLHAGAWVREFLFISETVGCALWSVELQLPRSLRVLLFPSQQPGYIIISGHGGTRLGKLGAMLIDYSALRILWELRITSLEVIALVSVILHSLQEGKIILTDGPEVAICQSPTHQ